MSRRLCKARTLFFDSDAFMRLHSVTNASDLDLSMSDDNSGYVGTTKGRPGVCFYGYREDCRNITFRAWKQHAAEILPTSIGTNLGVPAVVLGHSLVG